MPGNSESARHISIGLWAALFLLMGLQVVASFSGHYLHYWVLILPIGVTLLSIASNVSEAALSPPRVMVGLWLTMFLRWGVGDIFYYDYPIGSWPWIGYLAYGLIIGVLLLVIASKRVASLGVIRLTVYAGFLMVFAYYLFGLLHDYYWFGMYTRLGMMSQAEEKTRLHNDASSNERRKRGRHARPRADNEAISIAHYTTGIRG